MKILIVVDMQNDFIDMALGSKEAVAVVPNVVKRIKEANADIILTTKDTHGENYLNTLEGKKLPVRHCIKGTKGWELNEEVKNALEEQAAKGTEWLDIEKVTFGYKDWDGLLSRCGEAEEIELCGLDTDICVISNGLIIRAVRPNVRMVIHSDCCAGSTTAAHEAALCVARSCQIDVI